MIDFPANPAPDQLFNAPNGVTYQWRLSPGAWTELQSAVVGVLNLPVTQTYASNAAALSGGLVAGDIYKVTTTNALAIVV